MANLDMEVLTEDGIETQNIGGVGGFDISDFTTVGMNDLSPTENKEEKSLSEFLTSVDDEDADAPFSLNTEERVLKSDVLESIKPMPVAQVFTEEVKQGTVYKSVQPTWSDDKSELVENFKEANYAIEQPSGLFSVLTSTDIDIAEQPLDINLAEFLTVDETSVRQAVLTSIVDEMFECVKKGDISFNVCNILLDVNFDLNSIKSELHDAGLTFITDISDEDVILIEKLSNFLNNVHIPKTERATLLEMRKAKFEDIVRSIILHVAKNCVSKGKKILIDIVKDEILHGVTSQIHALLPVMTVEEVKILMSYLDNQGYTTQLTPNAKIYAIKRLNKLK